MPLRVQPLVELGGQERSWVRDAGGDGVAVFVVVSAAAGGAWAVAGGKSGGVHQGRTVESIGEVEQGLPASL